MSRLQNHITSDFVRAANMMRSKTARKRIIAYVESYDDIFFWRTVLSQFEDETRYFEVMLPSRTKLKRGKKSVLMNLLRSNVGDSMIACVDADYDYLLQGANEMSREVVGNPYVFHTYVYAIENFQCYAPSLHNVAVSVTLNDSKIFAFQKYIEAYSKVIYPLFVWSIWLYRKSDYSNLSISDFNKIVDMGHFTVGGTAQSLNRLAVKVKNKLKSLNRIYPHFAKEKEKLETELSHLGVTPQTTYLYIQGHHLFDNIVMPMMKKVCDMLIKEREMEIQKTAIHYTQMRNELSCYSHSVEDIEPVLKRNVGYVLSEPFRRLLDDIGRFLSKTYASPQS